MPKIDLLPCPFCGKRDTAKCLTVAECECIDDPTEWNKTHYGIVCDASILGGCGASTGWNHETPEEAAKAWNTRASGWIPCSERMPENDHYVLVWHKPNDMIYTAVLEYYANGWELDDNLGEYRHASFENAPYWMPLPEAPKRKDDTHDYD